MDVWVRTVTVVATVLAILVVALATELEISYQIPPDQTAIATLMDADCTDTDPAQTARDTKCNSVQNCIPALVPSNPLVLTQSKSTQERPRMQGHQPTGAGFRLFHPPRTLSQV